VETPEEKATQKHSGKFLLASSNSNLQTVNLSTNEDRNNRFTLRGPEHIFFIKSDCSLSLEKQGGFIATISRNGN
jgi:hypothetical protein